jgi:Family of unknown function (DUF6502)
MGNNSQMNNASATGHLLAALLTLMRPLVRFLLARGIAFDSFVEVAKRAFIEVAEKDFGIPGKRQTDSRISVLTGLTRKEVARVRDEVEPLAVAADQRLNRAARVVSGWVRDFASAKKNKASAMTLAMDGGKQSFAELVKRYSGDMPVQSVLDELLRAGTVTRLDDGSIQLVNRTYLSAKDEAGKVFLLGSDARDLIATITHNLDSKSGQAYFQRKTSYNNLPANALNQIRDSLRDEGQQFLERFDRKLAAQDRDMNPAALGEGRKRAVVGLYYFEEDVEAAASASMERSKKARGKQQ